MSELQEFEFERPVEPPEPPAGPPPGSPRRAPWVAALVALLVAAGGAVIWLRRAPSPKPAESSPPTAVAQASPSPAAAPASALPPLGESDALVRELARAVSSHPQLAAWLAAEELVRRFTGAVVSVAEGDSPRGFLDFLAPKGSFAVLRRGNRTVVDPRSYARYDVFVEAFGSLDAGACGRVYGELRPLLESAYRELGFEGDFSDPVRKAFRRLLETPIPDGDLAVRRAAKPGTIYEYVDPRLESLSPAQKHLLRLGPANARRVQAKLRELAQALDVSVS